MSLRVLPSTAASIIRSVSSSSSSSSSSTISSNSRLWQTHHLARAMATMTSGVNREFAFPSGTKHRVRDRKEGLAKHAEFARALQEHGILSIDMGFPDPDSTFILEVVEAIGCKAQSHSSKDGPLWDITWKPEGTAKDPSGKDSSGVWSHSLDEMSWHTDGSFEHKPMPFFGFHILHSDHEGGGRFRVVRADEIARRLSPESLDILTSTNLDLRVPSEFQKDVGSVRGKLIHVDPRTKRLLLRYRSSVLNDPPAGVDAKANAAVAELQSLLHDGPESIGETVPPSVFKDNSILLMDNARYLHSRTKVEDEKRHLRRVRFEGSPGQHLEGSQ